MPAKSSNLRALVNKAIPVCVGMALLFLSQAFLARVMGPGSFGIYSYFLTWITVAALLAKAGHEWVLLKAIPARARAKQAGEIKFLVLRALRAVGVRAILAALILFVLALTIGHERQVDAGVTFAGALLIIALSVAEIRRAIALAYGAIWLAETPENIVKSLLLIIIAALLGLIGAVSPASMLWSNLLVTFATSSCAALIFMRRRGRDVVSSTAVVVDTKDYDDLMRSMWLTNLLNIILRNADILIIGAITDPATTGIYIAATRVAAFAAAPVMILDRIVAPSIAEAAQRGDRAQMSSSSWEYAALSTAACLVLVVFMGVGGSQFISILFGEEYQGTLIATWILLAGNAANALTGPTGVLLSMTGSHRLSVIIASICAMLYIILLYALTPIYLAVGAAVAFAVTHTMKAILQIIVIRTRLQINPTVFRWHR